ncbi:MAG: radical SAM protein [Caldisericia bacterium]|nr:radical SAM protein [Caldisericia bacterium]
MNVMPSTIRVSIASASILGFKNLKYDFEIKTIYLLVKGKCLRDCKYCTQAKSSKANEKFLSRVIWPEYDLNEVINRILEKKEFIERICLQTVNNRYTKDVIFEILKNLGKEIKISISINTNSLSFLKEIFNLNADRVGFPIDVANEKLYKKLRGGDFNKKLKFILKAGHYFENKISTHIIVGLGESDKDILSLYKTFIDNKITVAIFSFTPVEGTSLENRPPPSLVRYRKIQIATKLIENGYDNSCFEFDEDGNIKRLPDISFELFKKLNPFTTRGCPYCTRPFYNERPKGDLYNYPFQLSEEDFEKEFEFLKKNSII